MDINRKIFEKKDIIVYDKNKLLDIISCPICLEKYKYPRNLKCGHPFCTTCLHMLNINNEIICPMCRTCTTFDKNNLLTNLPVNNTLISIIDETEDKLNQDNIQTVDLKIKRSKSLDSFVKYKKTQIQRDIYYNNISNDLLNENKEICNYDRECCTFQ